MRTFAVAVFFVVGFPLLTLAASGSDIHFTPDGKVSAKNLIVFQKSGTNLFTRATWGNAFIRVTLVPGTSTVIQKAHGEAATIADIKEQDVLDVDGSLVPGADALVFNVTSIHDYNLQTAGKTVAGTVLSVNPSTQSFAINDKTFGKISVAVSGASLMKGVRVISFNDIKVGDKVTSAIGAYDYTSKTLSADSVAIYQDQSAFKPRNFQGTLKRLDATTLPTTALISVGGTDYTVYLAANASILSNARKISSLTRFVVGDTVRFYGAIRPENLSEIDSDLLRDLNF